MKKWITLFCLMSGLSSHADVIDSVRAARWSLQLYAVTQTFVSCLWWHNSEYHFALATPPNEVARLAEDAVTYPLMILITPPAMDVFVQAAVEEVKQNARAGDFDVRHSKTFGDLESFTKLNSATQCGRSAEHFQKTLIKYLQIETSQI